MKIPVIMAVQDVVAPEMEKQAQADRITHDPKLNGKAAHIDMLDHFPGGQIPIHVKIGCENG